MEDIEIYFKQYILQVYMIWFFSGWSSFLQTLMTPSHYHLSQPAKFYMSC